MEELSDSKLNIINEINKLFLILNDERSKYISETKFFSLEIERLNKFRKKYPEEVEEAVKRHPDIYDCLVVGVDDDRFGQRVVALASFQDQKTIEEQDLISFTREHLAGFKLPKQVFFVEEVMRAPNGKANYKWAKERAAEELS